MIKNVKHVELNKYCDCFLEYPNFKDNLIEHKCFNRIDLSDLVEYKL